MKIPKKSKKYIKNNYKNLSAEELAQKTNLPTDTIKWYLKKTGKRAKKIIKTDQIIIRSFKDVRNYLVLNLDFIVPMLIITFLIYAYSLNGAFVSDDIPMFVNNEKIRDFFGVLKTFNFQNIYFSISYHLFGTNPIPLHLMSLLQHLVSTTLVFIFISMIFSKRVAKYTTILFALHPINSETVSWISANGYSYRTILLLLGLISYGIFKNTSNKKYFILSVAVFPLAIITRRYQGNQSLIIPAIFIVVDQFFYEKRISLKSLLKLWPFYVVAIAFVTYDIKGILERISVISPKLQENIPYHTGLFYTVFKSLELLIFPNKLSIFHEGEILSKALYIVMALSTIGYSALTIYFWRKNRKIAGLLLIIPASIFYTLMPIKVSWFAAERYLYPGTLAFCALIALGILKIEKKYKIKNFAILTIAIIATLYSIRTVIRTNDWKNRKNLWEATRKTNPLSARVYNNLGDVYAVEKDFKKSIEYFTFGMKLDPDYAELIHNLGNTYAKIREFDLAEKYLKKSFELNPTIYQAPFHLGVVELERGNYQKSLEYFNQVLEIQPNYEPAHQAISLIQRKISEK